MKYVCMYLIHETIPYLLRLLCCLCFRLLICSDLFRNAIAEIQHHQTELLIRGPNLHVLTRHHFKTYNIRLEHLSLVDTSELHGIESGCLRELKHLHSLYISGAPKLKKLPHETFRPPPPSLKSLRIIYSGLKELPDLSALADESQLMHIVDFEGNKLQKLKSHGIRVRADQLIFDYNEIEEIDEFAFKGSELAELSLKGNYNLKILHENSFGGLTSIRELDISDTSILFLPVAGLSSMEVLKAENVISMKTIPSIHEFKNLREARLTHHFHCCAFRFPQLHDPVKHEKYVAYVTKLQKLCSRNGGKIRQKRQTKKMANVTTSDYILPINLRDNLFGPWSELIIDPNDNGENEVFTETYTDDAFYDDGVFHQTTAITPTDNYITFLCNNTDEKDFNINKWQDVVCTPESDALNPCEDVLGSVEARVIGWGGSLAATLGNLGVAIVFLSRPLAPPRVLLLLLSSADLATALYLLSVAAVDTHTANNYFNHAYDWQYGLGCRIAGFLAVWGAQASLLALAALTLERWLAITRAMSPQRRLSPRGARTIILGSVIYSIVVASAPLLGASHFSSTSICLPMRCQNWVDILYLSCLLCGGLLCLFTVIGCYVHIYFTLARDSSSCTIRSGDASVANKMAILILIHLLCCIPVAIVGFGALIGYPILSVHGAKLLLVLIYPLNALADPFLYAILTHQFRRDLYLLLDRYGICSHRAQQYKLPGVVGRRSNRRASNSLRNRRPDGSLTTGYEDLLV